MTSSPSPDPLLRPKFTPLLSFSAQLSSEHRPERFHVLQSGASFYLRLQGHPDWLGVLENDARLSWLAHSKTHGPLEREEWQERVMNRQWGRVLSLSDPLGGPALWRVLWKGKRTFLMRAETGELVDFRTDDDWKRGAWIQPNAHFAKRFAREWNRPDSDVRRAHDFLAAGTEARRLWGLDWMRGSWSDLKPVLRSAATVEHEWGDRTALLSRTIGPQDDGFGSNAPISGRLLRLIHRLEEVNTPLLRDQSRLRRLAPHPFNFTFGVARWPELRVEVDPPSEHERLEARLDLRDWLRSHAPDLLPEWS